MPSASVKFITASACEYWQVAKVIIALPATLNEILSPTPRLAPWEPSWKANVSVGEVNVTIPSSVENVEYLTDVSWGSTFLSVNW